MHHINVPEREEFNGVVKTMKFSISFLCSNIFLNFLKVLIIERCERCY